MKAIQVLLLLTATTFLEVRRCAASSPSTNAVATNTTTTVNQPVAGMRWGPAVLEQKPEWYVLPDARVIADSVVQYQSPHGAWPKNTNLSTPPSSPDVFTNDRVNTIDNGATTTPMRFLALMVQATGNAKYRSAFESGVDYLLAAQYSNGGWPQFFPLRKGYYSHITYNDDAMANVLTLLRAIADGEPPYDFVDKEHRAKAAAAVTKGIDCILRTQIKQDGKLTAWCAQYDEVTLQPAWARKYEPPSLSGRESVGVVRVLMEVEQPTPAIIAAIEGAVEWFKRVAIPGVRDERFTDADGNRNRRIVPDSTAGLLWARFYELGTNRPIFLGRDSMVHYAFSEIERERRAGYAYYGDWPASLLAKDHPCWRQKQRLP